jgi:hypothetical protein
MKRLCYGRIEVSTQAIRSMLFIIRRPRHLDLPGSAIVVDGDDAWRQSSDDITNPVQIVHRHVCSSPV